MDEMVELSPTQKRPHLVAFPDHCSVHNKVTILNLPKAFEKKTNVTSCHPSQTPSSLMSTSQQRPLSTTQLYWKWIRDRAQVYKHDRVQVLYIGPLRVQVQVQEQHGHCPFVIPIEMTPYPRRCELKYD